MKNIDSELILNIDQKGKKRKKSILFSLYSWKICYKHTSSIIACGYILNMFKTLYHCTHNTEDITNQIFIII